MELSLKQAALAPLASHQATSYMIPEKAQIAAAVFPYRIMQGSQPEFII
jgi:hypothetical protein